MLARLMLASVRKEEGKGRENLRTVTIRCLLWILYFLLGIFDRPEPVHGFPSKEENQTCESKQTKETP